jgi:cobalt-zinc-cadmium efflux system outer membrane protein
LPYLLAAGAAAQPLLTPQQAVETALRSHPLLGAAGARTTAAGAWVVQSGLRPNPRLYIQTENWRPYGTPGFSPNQDADIYAFITQPLETAGKRERRLELARAGLHRTELEREVLARQIGLRVRQAYWNAAAAEKLHRLLIENAQNFQQIVDYHVHRVREGAMPEADLVKVQIERERLDVSIHTAALEAERARVALFREMGQTAYTPVTLADLAEDASAVLPAIDLAAAPRRPEIQLARQLVEQARANLTLQRANAKPDVDLVTGYKRISGFNTWLGGVQVNLPTSNRNQGAIAAAEADLHAAEFELTSLETTVAAEVRTAATDVRARAEQLTRLFGAAAGTGLRGKAAESSRIALAAYQEGGTDLLRLLDAQRVQIDLQVLYYRTLADYRQSVIALEAALGVNP